ncbi:MAG: TlpA disulfide reductase family protein [Pirellulales bacterium]
MADEIAQTDPVVELPRYRFKVGQELVYQLTCREDPSDHVADVSTHLDHMEWRCFVVQRNDDGSWRLFIRTDLTFLDTAGKPRAKRQSLGYCDLRPDGSYALDEQTAILKRLVPHELFCRLPDQASELDAGWSYDCPVERLTYDFTRASRENTNLRIRGVANTPYNETHRWETTRQYEFNLDRGLVERIVVEFRGLSDRLVRDRRTIELKSMVQRDSAWVSQFHAEANDYLAAYTSWSRLINDAAWVHSSAVCETVLHDARPLLVAGRDKAGPGIVQAMYDANIQEHDEHSAWAIDHAKKREAYFAMAPEFSADWQTKRLDGGTFRLTELRGKIVVLDFWSTSCEYCVLAAPQVAQLAAEYQAKGVEFIGMFDRRESDDQQDAQAQSLIKNVYHGIPHFEGHQIAEHYRLNAFGFGYPALVILDQSGIVHEVHSGYTADLPQRMRTILDGMLSKQVDSR